MEVSALIQIWCQVESEECESFGVLFKTDLIAPIMPHKSCSGKEWGITSSAQIVGEIGCEWFSRNLFPIDIQSQVIHIKMMEVVGILVFVTIESCVLHHPDDQALG